MSFSIKHIEASTAVVFENEQWERCAGPLDAEFASELGKIYGFKDVVVHAGQGADAPLLWVARNGHKTIGKRRLRIARAHGNAFELAVQVDGETADAVDALRELWADLGEIAGLEQDLDQAAPVFDHSTHTSVRTDLTFAQLFGVFADGLAVTKNAMGARLAGGSPANWSMRYPLPVQLYGWRVDRWLLVERRVGAESDDRSFFVSSPLPSHEHRAVLEALFGS